MPIDDKAAGSWEVLNELDEDGRVPVVDAATGEVIVGVGPSDEDREKADDPLYDACPDRDARAARIARVPELEREVNRLKAENDKLHLANKYYCVYCDEPLASIGAFGAEAAIGFHLSACPAHPIRKAEAEVERLKAENDALRHDVEMFVIAVGDSTKMLIEGAKEVERLTVAVAELARAARPFGSPAYWTGSRYEIDATNEEMDALRNALARHASGPGKPEGKRANSRNVGAGEPEPESASAEAPKSKWTVSAGFLIDEPLRPGLTACVCYFPDADRFVVMRNARMESADPADAMAPGDETGKPEGSE